MREGRVVSMSGAVPPHLEERSGRWGVAVRSSPTGNRTMSGHFAVFNRWTEIDSAYEGRFMERIAPGSFLGTFAEDRDRMRVRFNHGRDPSIGDKVLGPIVTLREEGRGAYYEVPLLTTFYNADLLPGLEAGLYGSSFRFRVVREELVDRPGASGYNPEGLPERTIREAQVFEFGPVTFSAYEAATARPRLVDRPGGQRQVAVPAGRRSPRPKTSGPEVRRDHRFDTSRTSP